jgi:NADPH:quinone reductase-like Zn-dependent oxidoreductase
VFGELIARLDCPEKTSGRRQDGDAATGATLVYLGPSSGFEVRPVLRREPAAGEIEVAVAAASVNPIDVQRAQGYGRRLLSLVGAGRFPMVLGNDFTGTVTTLGDMSTRSRSTIGSMA